MINVLFFAQLRERLGCAQLQVDGDGISVLQLKQQLAAMQPHWPRWLLDKDLLAAVNQTLATSDAIVYSGDEVALFPPVTGG